MGIIAATPAAKRLAKQRGLDIAKVRPANGRSHIIAADVMNQASIKATPTAKRVAQQRGIDLNAIKCGGRIFKRDVLAAGANGARKAEVRPFQNIKKITARRMLKSHLEIPPVTLNAKADITWMLICRAEHNKLGGVKLSINDYVVYAVAQALKSAPEAYASYSDDGLILNPDINIGVATALDKGLIVPVVKNADRLSLEEISTAVRDLASRARSGKLLPEEYSGGTFTISNLGMYGVASFNPIINLPESMILGVCAVEQELYMKDRAVRVRDRIGLSLTFDHRVHDGAQAAAFLKTICEQLESYEEGSK